MASLPRGPVPVTLAAVAVGALIAAIAFWGNGLEEASWVAAIVAVPLTVVSLVIAMRDAPGPERRSGRAPSEKAAETPGAAPVSIVQKNNHGPNIAHSGSGDNVVISGEKRDPRTGRP